MRSPSSCCLLLRAWCRVAGIQRSERLPASRSPLISESLQHRFANDFFDGRDSFFDLDEARTSQADHASLGGVSFDVHGRTAGEDQVTNAVVDLHDLDEADATLVARVVAFVAATPLEDDERPELVLLVAEIEERLRRDLHLFLAVRADTAYEALSGNELDRGGHQERLDAHVHQPVDRR